MKFTGIVPGVITESITFARGATVLDAGAFIGMASVTQRYKGTNESPKDCLYAKTCRLLTVSLDINMDVLGQKRYSHQLLRLISAGRVNADDGDKGWRRCLYGHRMIIVGFEDSSAGQRRVVVKDLVGGLGLKDAGSSGDQSTGQELSWQDGQQRHVRKVFQNVSNEARDPAATAIPLLRKYPPSGGLGMRALAVWSYWPIDDASDELSFPRGAELQEVEDINGDWFLGSYAGKMGLFPSNHVRCLDVVKS
ncbi:MAG: hypothetical protein Q9166_004250 [cf. Caloplaca sp. 2 TL-2023]